MKMKLVIVFTTLLLIVACSDQEKQQDPSIVPSPSKEVEEVIQEKDSELNQQQEIEAEVNEDLYDLDGEVAEQIISEAELREIIEYSGMGEEDLLISTTIEDSEIKATIEMASHEFLTPDVIAESLYSSLSDELFNYEGWDVLTVTYQDVGTISMNRNEKESNEYGDYFPTIKIMEKLKN